MPNIVVPTLGESVVEARVAKWLKQEGQAVSAGEPVVELETEKIDLEVSAEVSGVLTSITRREGEDVKIGEVLGVVSEGATATAAAAAPAAEAAKPAAAPASASAPAPAAAAAPAPATDRALGADETRATPTARRVAEKNAVDLGGVTGTGAQGRVLKQDVEAALGAAPKAAPAAPASIPSVPAASAPAQPAPAPAAAPAPAPRRPEDPRGERRVRMTKRRATIARRLV